MLLEKTKNLMKKLEIIRITENHLGCCNRFFVNVCIVCKILFPKRSIHSHFLTIEHLVKYRERCSPTFTKQNVITA